MYTLVAFLVTLAILIVVHELGHYWAARWCGVKVLRFSVGFGKPLFSRRRGVDQTEWCIAAFPLGGYVKMLDETEGEVSPTETHRAFNRQPVLKRMVIVVAGPLANFLLAIFLYWVLLLYGVQVLKPVIGTVPEGSPAAVAGFHTGETITKVADEAVVGWQEVRWALLKFAASKETVGIETSSSSGVTYAHQLDLGGVKPDDLEGDLLEKIGLTRFQPELPARIGALLPEGAAARDGLLPGDEITHIDDLPIQSWKQVVEWVRGHPGMTATFVVRRGNDLHSVRIVPDVAKESGKSIGRIGASPQVDPELWQDLVTEVSYPLHTAFLKAVARTWEMSIFSLEMMGRMLVGQVSWRNLSGPITIADYAGQAAHMGGMAYLGFLALISVSLGVLNLLPVPLLDGGHLMYYIAELIKGSPVSEKVMEIGQQVGMAVLLLLMVFAFYNDINRLIAG